MTSGRLFSKAARLDRKRELPWAVVYLIWFFLVIPLRFLFMISELSGRKFETLLEKKNAYLNAAVTSVGMPAVTVFLLILAAVEAYHTFGYLHRGTEVDFYHSLPQTRRQLFALRFLQGAGRVLKPCFLMTAAGVAIALAAGIPAGKLLPAAAEAILLNALAFLLTYALCILAVMLTGRPLTGFAGMAVLAGVMPAAGLLISAIPSEWFSTYVSEGTPTVLRILGELSPLTQAAMYIGHYRASYDPNTLGDVSAAGFLLRVLLGVSATLLLIMLSIRLYEKRPLERYRESMVFRVSEPIIRIPLTALAGIAGMDFMRALGRGTGWVLFGSIATAALVHFGIELIYSGDARKIFSNWRQLLAIGIALIALIVVLDRDLTGFERYIPKEEKVQGASISSDNYLMQFSLRGEDEISSWYYASTIEPEVWHRAVYGEPVSLTDPANIKALQRIAGTGVAHLGDSSSYRGFFGGYEHIETVSDSDVRISATIHWDTGANTVSRKYILPLEEVAEDLNTLYNSDEYKKWSCPLYGIDADRDISLIAALSFEEKEFLPLTERTALVEAYTADTSDRVCDVRHEDVPVGLLQFYLDETLLDKILRAGLRDFAAERGEQIFVNYPVYASDARTIALLKENGISMPELPEHVAGADVFAMEYYEEATGDTIRLVFTKAEDLAVIRENIVDPGIPESMWLSNGLLREGYVTVTPQPGAAPGMEVYANDWYMLRDHEETRALLNKGQQQ